MIKRLENIQKGQEVYIVPSDSRHQPFYAKVKSVGPKKIILMDISPDLREFDSSTGRSIKWGGWELYSSEEQYLEIRDLASLKIKANLVFNEMVKNCDDASKLRRLIKRYSKYENNQSV